MTLEYTSNLADVAEVHWRLFYRSKTYGQQRIVLALTTGGLASVLVYLMFKASGSESILSSVILAMLGGIAVSLLTSKHTAKRRIYKYIAREYGEEFPTPTVYSVGEGRLNCSSMGNEISFSLSDLEECLKNDGRLELSFGKRGLCLIPFRAFETESSMDSFIARIQAEQVEASDRSPLS